MHILAPTQEGNHVGNPPFKNEGEQGGNMWKTGTHGSAMSKPQTLVTLPTPPPSYILLAEMIVTTKSHTRVKPLE